MLSHYRDLIKDLIIEEKITLNKKVKQISYDSQRVGKDCLFLCKGENFQEKYLADAQNKGAFCYISEKKHNDNSDYILVSDLRLALGKVVAHYFNSENLTIPLFGITGTKGKTTTSMMLRGIFDSYLKEQGLSPSALLCSVLTYDGEEEAPSRMTTKEPIELNQHIAKAQRSKTPMITMEVSSQAVKYHRIYGLTFEMGCYLNIGEDHISPLEHPDFEDYFQSKLDFFKQCRHATINLDGVHTDRVLQAVPDTCKAVTCSRLDETADFYVKSIEKKGIATQFTLKTPRGEETYMLQMAGLFNLDNALAAISMAQHMNIPQHNIAQGLLLGRTPGRMEFYTSADEKISILVDYAHNKMSFQALFSSICEEFPQKKKVAVFGCPGEKALDRRKDMGEIADQYADFCFLSEDDPANEPIEEICKEIGSHMKKGQFTIQVNRELAIEEACNMYPEEEKVVLLLGKGAESDQKRGNLYVKNPTDAQLAIAFLEAYDQMQKAQK